MTNDEAVDPRSLVTKATQRLLGDTMVVQDAQWTQASRLPGWTRAHVATHLARNADALARVLQGVLKGTPVPMYAAPDIRDREIDEGANRGGLELQTDLDTSADRFIEALDRVDALGRGEVVVELRGGRTLPAAALAGVRLGEVVLHHVDLDIGLDLSDVDDPTAVTLLTYGGRRMSTVQDMPAVRLEYPGGAVEVIPPGGSDPVTLAGTPQALVGWLTGRDGGPVDGPSGVFAPPY